MSPIRIIIVLFILSEIPAVFYGAIGAWRSRSNRTKRRTVVGMLAALALVIYGIARLMALTTSMQYGPLLTGCLRELEPRSLIQAVTQASGSWVFAFAFTGDDQPGWFRSRVNAFVGRYAGKAISQPDAAESTSENK